MSDTPLALYLKDLIGSHGRLTVEAFMETCLQHDTHGYYRRGGMLGTAGDFTTAPEISQVFGELIGLWCAVVWQSMGRPERLHLIEFGPGRGTMMADALRAAKVVPGFHDAVCVHLVEASEPLQGQQRDLLKGYPRVACNKEWPVPDDLDPGGVIVIGNEFLDALPIEQFVFHDGAWRLRGVGLNGDGDFVFVPAGGWFDTMGVDLEPTEGDVFEASGVVYDLAYFLAQHVQAGQQVAALFIDYGHVAPGFGDTLQGVKGHRYVSPFEAPGETDLTTQVDFATAARVIEGEGLVVEAITTQNEFLGALGIVERASKLMAANPGKAAEIEAGVARLMAPNGMGIRFKMLGARSATLPPLPGFPAALAV